ncbi:hypothetical protein MC7420_1573 [Coleofasciculus chthonoplastes PCC 7420]|uniref:Uncharacterized protein n=1 Tax=Coleofasciculus chthonoplastes PCC 7420 TaxID=118168 RepID=B4W383_9CYAN|nr:hypothetical protein MC7420_1573 [Coleofasciculus chthonoplastes PCC 7420]
MPDNVFGFPLYWARSHPIDQDDNITNPVGAHGVRPVSPQNLFHNFSCVTPLVYESNR